ncbi:hypothetical protein RAB70_19100 [Xanthomonas sontii]|uniref:hypothetical protein n=1 Tax=Xanthomonas sontii TaxID=2650745 RepID=UPI0014782363|nr:hypothetical protein [Xanthomonas sontii]MDQ7759084.1 hypothetical protein [Xanthomonas sontii]
MLLRPTGAGHHPQEIRLDPAHPVVAELAAEALVVQGELRNRRAIHLVDIDRIGVEARQDVTALARPGELQGSARKGMRRRAAYVVAATSSIRCRVSRIGRMPRDAFAWIGTPAVTPLSGLKPRQQARLRGGACPP